LGRYQSPNLDSGNMHLGHGVSSSSIYIFV